MKMKEIIASMLLGTILGFAINLGSEGKHEVSALKIESNINKLNKPPMKSIQDEDGSVIDCIDIYQQPAFDHPLLKNHRIQMKPSTFPTEMINGEDKVASEVSLFGKVSCPQGSVPIPRTTKEQLLLLNDVSKLLHNSSNYNSGYHFATVSTQDATYNTYYGVRARINVRSPKVSNNQSSAAAVWLKSGPTNELNSIQFGWMVNPKFYGDYAPRIYTHWTADSSRKTGCFNLLCPGFVQVASRTFFGTKLEYFKRGSPIQSEMETMIFMDPKTKNWWLTLANEGKKIELIGYWPNSIFTHLKTFAASVEFGGRIYGVPKGLAPEMGSGKFLSHDPTQTSYVAVIHLIIDFEANKLVEPKGINMITKVDACYVARYLGFYKKEPNMRYSMTFGGPINKHCTI